MPLTSSWLLQSRTDSSLSLLLSYFHLLPSLSLRWLYFSSSSVSSVRRPSSLLLLEPSRASLLGRGSCPSSSSGAEGWWKWCFGWGASSPAAAWLCWRHHDNNQPPPCFSIASKTEGSRWLPGDLLKADHVARNRTTSLFYHVSDAATTNQGEKSSR